MPSRDIHRAAMTSIIAAAITLGPALDAGQAGAQSVQYRSPEGVEYRSLPDTDAVKSARAALDADPRNITRIIDLGVAQSGARQFREAIATFTRGLEIELYRGEIGPEAVLTPADTDEVQVATLAYGLGNWYFLRGDTAQARRWFERSIQSGGWPGFGFIVSEVELRRLR
jgi:tetratricopeptide (TPR) repeat protein